MQTKYWGFKINKIIHATKKKILYLKHASEKKMNSLKIFGWFLCCKLNAMDMWPDCFKVFFLSY